MFLYCFMMIKYLCESAALCFLLALVFTKRAGVSAQMVWRTLWLILLSAAVQTAAHFLCARWLPVFTFDRRYLFFNILTLWIFRRLRLRRELPFSFAMISYLLVTNQFCQIFATYIIFVLRGGISAVTQFGVAESLISTAIIWTSYGLISCITVRIVRDIHSLTRAEAGWVNGFIWTILLIGWLLLRTFMEAQNNPQTTVLVFVLFLVELEIFFACAMLMVRERNRGIEQARMNQQYALQIQHANELNSLYQEIRQSRHELKNQQIYVAHLLKEKKYDVLQQYYAQQTDALMPMLSSYDSGNSLVNAILWAKEKAAQRLSIPMEISAFLPETLPVEGHHLCSVLVNLLDNAIEASATVKDPMIRVLLRLKQSYLFCSVSNRVDPERLRQNQELRTTKQDALEHGFGIPSVKLIAQQYNGMAVFKLEDDFFCATAMLSCESDIHSAQFGCRQ